MKNKIYQVQIVLKRVKPKVWRRLLIPSDMLLSDFHKVIQTAMGWTNSHLHQFIKDKTFYTEKLEDDDLWGFMANVDYKKMKVSRLLKKQNDKMVYEYDFGDSWEHNIILEEILPVDPDIKYPICMAGKGNRPPEDIGGASGYEEFKKILSDPDHEEHEEYKLYVDRTEPFDKDDVNIYLGEENYGCIELF